MDGDYAVNADRSLTLTIERKHDDLKQQSDFVSLCSFIHYFGSDLGIYLTFEQLVRFLNLDEGVNWKKWETLHIKLLNQLKFRAKSDRWESVLARFIHSHARQMNELAEAANRLQYTIPGPAKSAHHPSLAYYSLDAHVRTKLLLLLMEAQFERNQSFKEKVNLRSAEDLRFNPMGHDVWGRTYWLFKDSEVNILLYREDVQHESIQLLCESTDEIRLLYSSLKDVCVCGSKLSDILANLSHPISYADVRSSQKNDWSSDTLHCPQLKCDISPLFTSTDRVTESLTVSTEQTVPKLGSENASDETVHSNLENGAIKIESPYDKSTVNEVQSLPAILSPHLNESDSKIGVDRALDKVVPVQPNHETKQCSKRSFKTYQTNLVEVRRSGRQRKPVEFLTMEPLKPKRTRCKETKSTACSQPACDTSLTMNHLKHKRAGRPTNKSLGVRKGKRRRKKRRIGDKRHRKERKNPWCKLSSSSETDDEDDTFEQAFLEQFIDSSVDSDRNADRHDSDWFDHPESDLDLDEVQSTVSEADSLTQGRNLARQRRIQKRLHAPHSVTANATLDDSVLNLSEQCQICEKSHSPEWILLCDRCDLGHHAMCLLPPLYIIPEGNWYCPRCQHAALLSALVECVDLLEAEMKKQTVFKRMQERLNFVNISMTNILADGDQDFDYSASIADGRRKRVRRTVLYKESNSDSSASSASVYSMDQSCDSYDKGSVRRDKRTRHSRRVNGYIKSRRIGSSFEEEIDSAASSNSSLCAPRAARKKPVLYNLNEAFRQLDEALETDEKYQEKKRYHKIRKEGTTNHEQIITSSSHLRGKDSSNIPGSDWKEFGVNKCRSRRRRLAGQLSSSSDSESDGVTDTSNKHGRRSSGEDDADFQPSSASLIENSSASDGASDQYSSDPESSDNSWLCVARHAANSRRTSTKKFGGRPRRATGAVCRRNKPIPRFEQSGDDDEGDNVQPENFRPQRRTRKIITYRESDDESEVSVSPMIQNSKSLHLHSAQPGVGSDDQLSDSPVQLNSTTRRRCLLSFSSESDQDPDRPKYKSHSDAEHSVNHPEFDPAKGDCITVGQNKPDTDALISDSPTENDVRSPAQVAQSNPDSSAQNSVFPVNGEPYVIHPPQSADSDQAAVSCTPQSVLSVFAPDMTCSPDLFDEHA